MKDQQSDSKKEHDDSDKNLSSDKPATEKFEYELPTDEADQTVDEQDSKLKEFVSVKDYNLSTLALVIVSVCALFVSIYQTVVLSGQQNVMASQQEVMLRNAKAQLWPNIELGVAVGYSENEIDELSVEIINSGTGPAIIEGVEIEVDGEYVDSWYALWNAINLPDSIDRAINNQTISNRVIQSGEEYSFLSLSDNPPMMTFVRNQMRENLSPVITICYSSVFGDRYMLQKLLWIPSENISKQVDECRDINLEFEN